MIAVDVGNTKTAIGFFRNGILTKTWKLSTLSTRSSDEMKIFLEERLSSIGESLHSAGPMILASVVPSVTDEISELKKEIDIHFLNHKSPLSFQIAVSQPETLGADRIANLEGSVRKMGAPLIVLDVGTATTLSVINSKQQFIGGMIAPGLRISAEALFSRAAKLQPIELTPSPQSIGTNTSEEMQVGIVSGHARMIDGLIENVQKELALPTIPIVATGGGIESVARLLSTKATVDTDLTLNGLASIHENLLKGKTGA